MFFRKKNKVYNWTVPDYTPQKCVGDYRWRERKTDSLIFMKGVSLPCLDFDNVKTSQDPSTYDLIYNVEAPEKEIMKYDVLPENGMAPLVNRRTLELLKELCFDDFQAFPAVIKGEGKGFESYENHGYSVVNITSLHEGIDRGKSNLEYFESGNIDTIRKLVMAPMSSIEGSHLFRDERCHTEIFVSPQLVSLFKEHEITGVKFITDGEFNSLGLG